MPPKAARGGARGRGRGRGRGRALAPSAPEDDQPAASQASLQDDHDSQSTVVPSSPQPAAPTFTTPQNELVEDADPSPNSSPATVPTETPAPTPIRPPATRPVSSSSMSSARGTGVSRGGRVKSTTESRFKPKHIRRDASELQQLAQVEQQRLAKVAAENARVNAIAARGQRWIGRGRGDAMGRGAGRGRPVASASGVFGVMPEALKLNPGFIVSRPSGASSSGGGPSGSKSAKGEAGTFSRGDYINSGGAKSKDWNHAPQYPGEDESIPRVDIEQINLVSDSEDDVIITGSRPRPNERSRSSKGGLKPVRLHREEHKERVTLVNTEPAIKIEDSDDELPSLDELRSSRTAVKEKSFRVPEDIGDRIKAEPGLEVTFQGSRRTASPEVKRKTKAHTSSPESKRKTLDHIASTSAIDLDPVDEATVAKPKKGKNTGRPTKKKDKKPVIQTEEDRAEYERHRQDVAILADELGGLQGNLGIQPDGAEGDAGVPNRVVEERDKKEGRLYLFQFPPVLPELYNPLTGKPTSKLDMDVEQEGQIPAGENFEEDVQMGGMSSKGKGKAREGGNLSSDPNIKSEEEILDPDEKPKADEKRRREEVVQEEGWIGKLVVRESGKVELCWGGTNLLVGRGVDAGFLTTGVMVDMVEKGPPGGGAPEGKALSMGQVMGKFVVTPDWDRMV